MAKPGFIETKLTRLPKAELHVHLRNSMSTQLTERLAARNKVDIPISRIDGNEFVWTDFQDMLEIHDIMRPVLQTPKDYALTTENYLTWCAGKGMIYGELMISYSPAETEGITYQDQIEGIAEGIDNARAETGIEARIILSGIRHRGAEVVEKMAQNAHTYPHPYVSGFGLAGDELNYPPELFEKAFAIASDAGLACTIHAGEWTGPDSIRTAMNLPGVKRIGHGVRAAEDQTLMQELKDRNIALEICPASNVRLGVFKNYAETPIDLFYKNGLKVTLNTDDPPYFSTSISREYRRVAETFSYAREDMLQFTRNAIEAAFVSEELRQELLDKVI